MDDDIYDMREGVNVLMALKWLRFGIKALLDRLPELLRTLQTIEKQQLRAFLISMIGELGKILSTGDEIIETVARLGTAIVDNDRKLIAHHLDRLGERQKDDLERVIKSAKTLADEAPHIIHPRYPHNAAEIARAKLVIIESLQHISRRVPPVVSVNGQIYYLNYHDQREEYLRTAKARLVELDDFRDDVIRALKELDSTN